MKQLFFTLALALLPICESTAQMENKDNFSYTLSDPYKVVDGFKYYFAKNEEVLTVKFFKKQIIFQKFSGSKLNEVARKEAEGVNGLRVESFQEIGDKIYLFYSLWNRSKSTEQLFMREIDFASADFAGEAKLMLSVEGKVTAPNGDKFEVKKSFSGETILVKYHKYPEFRNDALNKKVFGLFVYNEDMGLVWGSEVQMPYTEKKMANLAFTVDDNTNVYMLTKVFGDQPSNAEDPNYTIELMKVDESLSLSNTTLDMDGNFTASCNFFEGSNNELAVAGYYNKSKTAGIDGFFVSRVVDESVEHVKFFEIPIELMKMYTSTRSQEKLAKKEQKTDLKLENMVLRNVKYHEDGSITIYGERYYTVSYTDSKTGIRYTTYYYQEIIGAGIDKDGELLWMNKLPKNQSSSGGGGCGYYLISSEVYDYILFLASGANQELTENSYPSSYSDGTAGYLTAFKVDRATGKTERLTILKTDDANGTILYQFGPRRIVKLSDSSFALECYIKDKKDVMLTIRLDD